MIHEMQYTFGVALYSFWRCLLKILISIPPSLLWLLAIRLLLSWFCLCQIEEASCYTLLSTRFNRGANDASKPNSTYFLLLQINW